MSEAENFEQVSKRGSKEVAKFEQPNRGLVGTIQHWLHVNPALVPLIVLVMSMACR